MRNARMDGGAIAAAGITMKCARLTIASLVATLALAAMLPGAARAQASQGADTTTKPAAAPRQVVIYRCTDAAGRVTIQNDVACPKGTKQQRQAIDVPPPVPAYVPREERMPAVVAAERADEAAGIAAEVATPAGAGPPPALYACRTWDQADFLTEDAKPVERCAPLPIVAEDGSTRTDAAACEKVADQCEAVPAEALCDAWQRRIDEAEFRWKFAGAKQDDSRRREYELLKARLAQSDCARGQNP